MINLSYSSLNSLIHEPHTWLCRQMGLKTVESIYAKEGKIVHDLVRDHLSGKKEHPLLKKLALPALKIVEEKDFDDRLRIGFDFSKKYRIRGFVDARSEDWLQILEIKSSGTVWAPAKFRRSAQWKIYALGQPKISMVYLLATPRDLKKWTPETLKLYNVEITKDHLKEAKEFIAKGIHIIEHIKDQKLHLDEPSRWCWYIGCPFCSAH